MRLPRPRRWPVRWRLAGASALLTLVILVAFAGVVGRLAADRLERDFRSELRGAASEIAFAIQVQDGAVEVPALHWAMMANRGAARVVRGGEVIHITGISPVRFGPLRPGQIVRVGGRDVATLQVPTPTIGEPVYVQFARNRDELEATIGRLWLFLALGVAGGTVLATIAGFAVANRAMRPIASLTATARRIATTRDPSTRIPHPESDDEVAELARTLDQMLRELDISRAEIEQMMQAQRDFVADASHELRTPLTSILANLEILAEEVARGGDRHSGEAGDAVASALRSSRRMSRLVGDLLLLARADAGRLGHRSRADLAEIARDALAEARPLAGEHRLRLRVDGPVPVDANPDELHRVASNLVDNAIRHTPSGCTIDVSVRTARGTAVLEVDDDGPGLPPGMHEQAFGRFVRGLGPADTSSATGGTGLGLAIVRAVARAHGGDVEAGSSPAGGARLTVTLPVSSPPGEPGSAAAGTVSELGL